MDMYLARGFILASASLAFTAERGKSVLHAARARLHKTKDLLYAPSAFLAQVAPVSTHKPRTAARPASLRAHNASRALLESTNRGVDKKSVNRAPTVSRVD
jgi:hypothetical protein